MRTHTPTATFKMKKSTKTLLASIANDNERNHFKRMMIDAQLAAQEKPKSKTDKKEQ